MINNSQWLMAMTNEKLLTHRWPKILRPINCSCLISLLLLINHWLCTCTCINCASITHWLHIHCTVHYYSAHPIQFSVKKSCFFSAFFPLNMAIRNSVLTSVECLNRWRRSKLKAGYCLQALIMWYMLDRCFVVLCDLLHV